MNIPAEFNEIRPYTPEELPQIYEELIADPAFRTVVESVMPGVPFEGLAMKMRQCKTNLEFQKAFFYGLLWDLVKKTANGLTFDCSALSDLTRNYTFISNHRDIILDSAFLSILLIDNGMTTVEIAIGDNLLIYPWIHKLVRVNKSFIVKRGLNMRQKLEASALMSRYMHFAMKEKHENLWIAQRQGRAKDSNDRTQDSVLKMMAMAGEGDVTERLKELNIVPLAISYEYDPCDFLKAKELQQKRDDEHFQKSPEDDLINMQTGLYYKVVDSDDWLDTDALQKVLSRLHTLVTRGTAPDLMICNYVYEHTEDGTRHTVRYTNIFPQERLFTWMHVGHFRPDQNLLMHSVMYRTEVLRKCGMVLPKHTFYVDNIFVYQPLPFVKTMYYMDLDLYRYFIGRADQSVNESIMVKRVDQQLRVTRHMIDCQDLDALKGEKKLRAYMLHYLSMMMAVSDIFLLLDGSAEAKEKQKGLWQYLREHTSAAVYRSIRFGFGGVTNLPFPKGDAIVVGGYRIARKIFKFN